MSIVDKYINKNLFKNYNYWFTRKDDKTFYVGKKIDPFKFATIATLEYSNDITISSVDDKDIGEEKPLIVDDFDNYKSRPEYLVGETRITSTDDLSMSEYYEKLLIGCYLCRLYDRSCKSDKCVDIDDPKYTKNVESAISWLRDTDFFECPASTRYHDNVPGGLVNHSLKVVNNIVGLYKLDVFNDKVKIEDAVFVSLIHDWCKIGLYESYMRNVKDNNGKWIQKEEYKYRDKSLTCFGHGVSSMFLAQKFFKLSLDEMLAIRWHMGFCRVADSDMNELQQSNETYPLVHMLQFADQLSIVKY